MEKDKEEVLYSGKIFEVLNRPVDVGGKVKNFEIVRRPPGTRNIIINDGKVLMSKEYRYEYEDYYYRLPGGKVFDSMKSYKDSMSGGKAISEFALESAKSECKEEGGIIPTSMKKLETTKAGSTVEWDLYFFLVEDFELKPEGQNLEEGEKIFPVWIGLNKAKEMCLNGQVKEDRTKGVLLKFLDSKTE